MMPNTWVAPPDSTTLCATVGSMMAADLNPLLRTEAEKFPALAVTQKPEFDHL